MNLSGSTCFFSGTYQNTSTPPNLSSFYSLLLHLPAAEANKAFESLRFYSLWVAVGDASRMTLNKGPLIFPVLQIKAGKTWLLSMLQKLSFFIHLLDIILHTINNILEHLF
ncbi:UNVERIFIED_CONTAM: hypothetical protein RMT77_017446 [Armadillidium vulgare]